MNTVTITLNDNELKELDRLSEEAGETREVFMLSVFKNFISDEISEEDAQDAREAEQAWEAFVASGKKAIPAEQVYEELGI